jgi:hypothetical protein
MRKSIRVHWCSFGVPARLLFVIFNHQFTRRGTAATKKEIPRRGAKTAERQSDLYRLKTLCALSGLKKTLLEKQENDG